MALQRMLLVPPELWENRLQASQPPVNQIIKRSGHSFDKWAQVRMHLDPYLKNAKLKRKPVAIPIVESESKTKQRRIIGSEPVFKSETDSESDASSPPKFSYVSDVLRRRSSHDPTFGVYQDDTDGSFKIGSSIFKYNKRHVFVDGKRYKGSQGLWELLSKSRPNIKSVTPQDREAYKQILLQSNAHRVNHSPSGRVKASKSVKYTQVILPLFSEKGPKRELQWETLQ